MEMTEQRDEKIRCRWVNLKNDVYVRYHDQEWGIPIYDDHKLFEMRARQFDRYYELPGKILCGCP